MNPSTRGNNRMFRSLDSRKQWKAVRDALRTAGYYTKIKVCLYMCPGGVGTEHRVSSDDQEAETFGNAILAAERLFKLSWNAEANTLRLIARGFVANRGLAAQFEASRKLGASDEVLLEMIEPVRPK